MEKEYGGIRVIAGWVNVVTQRNHASTKRFWFREDAKNSTTAQLSSRRSKNHVYVKCNDKEVAGHLLQGRDIYEYWTITFAKIAEAVEGS